MAPIVICRDRIAEDRFASAITNRVAESIMGLWNLPHNVTP